MDIRRGGQGGAADSIDDVARAADGGLTGSNVCGVNSFSADTTVATADGDVPISEIQIGDEVLAYNQATGETDIYTVTDTISHIDQVVVHLVIDGELIETTPEHPFYTIEGEWVNAQDLTEGDLIWSLDGDYGMVASVELIQTEQPMYNLTVDEAHTFFVGDGDWLVHNTDPCYVAFKAKLANGVDFPRDLSGLNEKQFDYALRNLYFDHNKVANQQVYEALQDNPTFRQFMEQNHPDIVEWVQPLPMGGFKRNPPTNWNWHHVPDNEGEMWLIREADHRRLRKELHVKPHNRGGMRIWGIIR